MGTSRDYQPLKKEPKKLAVQHAAQEFNRTVDPEHFGVNLSYSRGPLVFGGS